MSFASITFLCFFGIVMAVLGLSCIGQIASLARGRISEVRQWLLLAASYFFYGWWDWRFCFLMLLLTLSAYGCALKMSKGEQSKRLWTIVGVAGPLVILGFFKYFNFFLSSFGAAFGIQDLGTLSIILPVGISFYTFQSLSYVIDVAKGKYVAERSFRKIALYIAFFPQLVAGPIVKAGDFLPQLEQNRKPSWNGIQSGVWIFMFGMIKKVVLADHLSVFVDQVYATPGVFDTATIWMAMLAYALQIYFDFSGYSDMAVGCAKCMGYDLPRNFNLPYLSKSVTEFWKRWHISLSSWLQEYLYFSLGGSRRGNRYVNLMLTMVLGGLWHGAAWTFVAWGTLHGAALCVHKLWLKAKPRRGFGTIGNVVAIVLTCLFVIICWIPFRAETFGLAWQIFAGAFTLHGGVFQPYMWFFVSLACYIAAMVVAVIRSKKNRLEKIEGFYYVGDLKRFWPLTLLLIVIGLTLCLAYTGASPFIYFQF